MGNGTNIWDISRSGIDSINRLQKNLQDSMDQMDQAFVQLNNRYVCSTDGLGVYSDSINAAIQAMKKVNEENTKSLGNLMQRLGQYEARIRMELEKRGEI